MQYYLSASSIKDFIDCSKRYYFRTQKAEGSETTPNMEAGTLVHGIVEKHWDKSKSHNLTLALKQSEAINLPEEMISRVQYSINSFHDNFQHLLGPEDEIEVNFKIPLDKDVFLVGRIDRILKPANVVLDWKTAQESVTSIDNDVQFLVYYYAFTRLYNRPPSLVSYVSLLHNRMINLNIQNAKYDFFVKDIIPGITQQVKAGNFYRDGIYRGKCFRCQFKETCLK
jgi:CRISPR/Cas system-associated exonuclease Cas4 (RecB family)